MSESALLLPLQPDARIGNRRWGARVGRADSTSSFRVISTSCVTVIPKQTGPLERRAEPKVGVKRPLQYFHHRLGCPRL